MRIHDDRAEHCLRSLATSLGKDAFSFKDWFCLLIEAEHVDREGVDLLLQLKDSGSGFDCDVMVSAAHDLFVLHKESDLGAYQTIYTTLCADDAGHDFRVYNLFEDRHTLRPILASKAAQGRGMHVAPAVDDLGENAPLRSVFEATKQQRRERRLPCVLVVEDDNVTRRVVAAALKNKYALITADTAHQAVELYLLHAPDIVFLDINLPDRSGFEVLRQLTACDPDAYVIMFSGNSYLDNLTAAFDAGASGFIAKPFDKQKLRPYIEGCFAHHGRACA